MRGAPLVLLALVAPASLSAQVRASEPGAVTQVLDGARITIEYSRPRSRGRDSLFGKVVKWGEVWTPGADWATTLDAGRDLTLDGHKVPRGRYSLWMEVRPSGPWTLILDPRFRRFHENRPDSTAAQIRFPVQPVQAPFVDALLWWWPELRPLGGTLAMQWGTTRVSLDVAVESRYPLTIPQAEAAPYLGRYLFKEVTVGDTARPVPFIVSYREGSLFGQWMEDDTLPFVMLRIRPDWFIPRWHFPGEGPDVYDVDPGVLFEFVRRDGRVVSFDLRDEQDSVMASAGRTGPR